MEVWEVAIRLHLFIRGMISGTTSMTVMFIPSTRRR
ncbi:hypothetical protein SLEP1_g7278 [Rubroshorea leprosula]|uniref:Uncharacterized protein n=1 Tax=Rubroshorea leprosula TaxID=152421 RepID=A0AAV5I3N8_9ROSI|nr:hypothetical protein SLEP1_g7278 [Rubroshorea leprosula]